MGDHGSHECPSCKEQAPRVMDAFGFGFKETPGKTGNSGVHKDDYPTADQAVGRSAELRWQHVNERNKVKDQVREMGQTHALMRRTGADESGTPFVEYEPMSPVGRDARRNLTKTALDRLKQAKDARTTR